MWQALQQARSQGRPETIADAEDALFRHYLPLAHTLAAAHHAAAADPAAALRAAETALAAAIVAWRYRDPDEFQPWASSHIGMQLTALTRRPAHPTGPRHQRPHLAIV